MTLHILTDLVQGSEEWHNARRGMITASVIGQLITPSTLKVADNADSRAITALLVAERITGWTDQTYVGADMERGWDDEPRALETYAEHYHMAVTKVGFLIRDDWGFSLGYSPDALVGDDGLIECKSRRPKKHLQTILADAVPADCLAQIQCGLLVSGRPWCDYLSYAGGMPLWRKRIQPDPRWQEAIVAAAEAFENAAEQMTADYRSAVAGLPLTERVLNDLGLVF